MTTATLTRSPNLSSEAIQRLTSTIRGEVFTPQDDRYDEARSIYNAMIDKRPALIVQCRCRGRDRHGRSRARDRHAAGDPGRRAQWSWPGHLRRWHRDRSRAHERRPGRSSCPHGAGRRWLQMGDVDHATHGFGMATPSGIISTTGVGGLTLGGGLGYLTRSCGLSIDNLLEADVVLADGSFVTASPESYPDLFWALRGGGGNFGVVTSFLLPPAPGRHGLRGSHVLARRADDRNPHLVSRFHRSGAR
ncbi:MAG: FAD-binding protein [Thermomicrobiales bacterium]